MSENTITPPPTPSSAATAKPGSKWPKILGIIMLVFAVLDIFTALFAFISPMITKLQMETQMGGGMDNEALENYISQLRSLSLLSGSLNLLLGILLLVAGIMMLKRKTICSPMAQAWGVLKILVGGYFMFRQSSLTKLQMDVMLSGDKSFQGEGAEIAERVMQYSLMAGMIIGLVFLCLLPIFLIVWLNRAKIKAQMAEW